jgi:hypothetical protein
MRIGGLSFGWFSNENGEPPHVHVFRGSDRSTSAKLWLKSGKVELAHNNARLKKSELDLAFEIVTANRTRFIAAWFDFFGD